MAWREHSGAISGRPLRRPDARATDSRHGHALPRSVARMESGNVGNLDSSNASCLAALSGSAVWRRCLAALSVSGGRLAALSDDPASAAWRLDGRSASLDFLKSGRRETVFTVSPSQSNQRADCREALSSAFSGLALCLAAACGRVVRRSACWTGGSSKTKLEVNLCRFQTIMSWPSVTPSALKSPPHHPEKRPRKTTSASVWQTGQTG